jgi:amidophosphoribosyltransferase
LIASHKSVDEIRDFIGADSLSFLSMEGMRAAVGDRGEQTNWCTSCYTGKYPTDFVDIHQIRTAEPVVIAK